MYPSLPNFGYGLNVNLRDVLELLPFTPAGQESKGRRKALGAEIDARQGAEERASDLHGLTKKEMESRNALLSSQAGLYADQLQNAPLDRILALLQNTSQIGLDGKPNPQYMALMQAAYEKMGLPTQGTQEGPVIDPGDLVPKKGEGGWVQSLMNLFKGRSQEPKQQGTDPTQYQTDPETGLLTEEGQARMEAEQARLGKRQALLEEQRRARYNIPVAELENSSMGLMNAFEKLGGKLFAPTPAFDKPYTGETPTSMSPMPSLTAPTTSQQPYGTNFPTLPPEPNMEQLIEEMYRRGLLQPQRR